PAHEPRRAGEAYAFRLPAGQGPDEGNSAGGAHERDRHAQRGAEGDGQREPGTDERDRRGERGRRRPLAQATRDEYPREQDDERRRGEPYPEPESGLGQEPGEPEQRQERDRPGEAPHHLLPRRERRGPP